MNGMLKEDLQYNWHPYTQMEALISNPPLLIEKAQGIKLFSVDGNFYYDTISSWWCNIHGHCHPRIVEAVQQQISRLDHIMFAGFTHEPVIELSSRLAALTPKPLERLFYSDNGSTAVETALKMSVQYWKNTGQSQKNRFISLDRGYHGDTVGCMSVSGVDLFVQPFFPLMFHSLKAPSPYCYRCPESKTPSNCSMDCFNELEKLLCEHSETVAGIIIEPILMGAGGMLIYPADYVSKTARLAKEYNVHLILDEVAVAFGRVGEMFACQLCGVSPDFLCLSKGLTGGILPLAVTMTTREVFEAFLGPVGSGKTFYHGHTFTGNPIGCAAAIANLKIFEEEKSLENVKKIAARLNSEIEVFAGYEFVGDVRTIGTVLAIELVQNKTSGIPIPNGSEYMRKIYSTGLSNGIILRAIGNVIYLFLPVCTNENELSDILARTHAVMKLET
ncbi:MAG: adenosylmethionine--8-amino-7-oxononanoate transaminase [Candidatus Riflebacteria bacterium]|nr:adenosylmethionine--8-amino-7-oxononanoate transaminase [Candidatus Riflebacteria bacterium]